MTETAKPRPMFRLNIRCPQCGKEDLEPTAEQSTVRCRYCGTYSRSPIIHRVFNKGYAYGMAHGSEDQKHGG